MNSAATSNTMQGKVALVTAAGKGIGEAVSRELARRGYQLALMGRSEQVMTLAQELGGTGFVGSVTDARALEDFVQLALEKYGRVDAVVTSTGHPQTGDLLEIGDADWHAAFDLVLMNVVRLARLVTPVMLEQGKGAFVNISSAFAVEPSLTFPVSSALRAALGGFTRLYTERYAAHQVRMNCVLVGRVDNWPISDEELRFVPAQRLATAGEVANLVAFLVSDEAAYIMGQSIRIDGGLTKSI